MTLTNVALYEALKPRIGEEAARMIAEVYPAARDLATKADIAALDTKIDARFAEVHIKFAEVGARFAEVGARFADVGAKNAETRGEIHVQANRTIRWMLAFFIPVWAGTWGTVVAIVLKA